MKLQAPRIAVIADSFWPEITAKSLRVSEAAESLARAGISVDIITPKKARSWPDFIRMEGVDVYRFDESAVMGLPLSRGAREVDRLLTKSGRQYSAIYLDLPGRRWDPVVRKLVGKKHCPVLVRFDPNDFIKPGVTTAVNEAGADTIVESMKLADAVFVPSADAERRVISQLNTSANAVVRFDGNLAIRVDRSIGARREVRRALGESSHELMCSSQDRILVSFVGDEEIVPLEQLLRQVGKLTEENRHLRWWLLGNIPKREQLYRQLKDVGCQYAVTMPGIMTHYETALQLADLVVLTTPASERDAIAVSCIRNRIPHLVPDIQAGSNEAESGTARSHDPIRFDPDMNTGERSLRSRVDRWLADSSVLENRLLELQNTWFATRGSALPGIGEAVTNYIRSETKA